ncbi:MAG: PilC/PilY family type IV pilus protein [Betaproteobacteria bacterium]
MPLETYSAPSSTDVKPNVLFVLDDSGSMDWDFMPDWACAAASVRNSNCSSTGQSPLSARTEYQFRNAAFNGMHYNPATNYKPPISVNSSGVSNTTTYPGMAGTSTATGRTSGSTPNWNAVKNDAYNVQSTSSSNLVYDSQNTSNTIPNHFFTIIPGEYCTTSALRICNTQSAPDAPGGTYTYPAPVRWCDSAALTNCKAGYDASFAYVRTPSPTLSIFKVAGNKTTVVNAITVGGVNILASPTAALFTPAALAKDIVSKINAAYATNGGYVAYANSDVVTIAAPYPGTATATPTFNTTQGAGSTTMTFTGAGLQFARQGNNAAEKGVPGASLMTMIASDRNSYSFPNTAAKGANRTDCTGTTCTYAEEMTNFANWWAYYHTRMQSMKTAASNAFSAIDSATDIAANRSRFRLGYMSINNNTNSDFVNLGEFTGSQKGTWYSKLIAAGPSNSTPLLPALSTAGRLYAGVLNGTSLNGITVTDPLQYSCQQNYTILSTDGFWNAGSTAKLNGSTQVGNQDAGLPRPLYDGGSAILQNRTSDLQKRITTTTTQFKTSDLQVKTGQLQTRTSANSGGSWTAWTNTTSCTWDTSGPARTQCQYIWGVNALVGSCTENNPSSTSNNTNWTGPGKDCSYTAFSASWSAPSASTCTVVNQSSAPVYTVAQARQCQTNTSVGAWIGGQSTCTVASGVACQYSSWSSWSNVASCTASPQSTAPNYTGPALECQTLVSGGTSNTLADVAAYYYGTDLRDTTSATGTCTGPIIPPNTIANNLCADNAKPIGRDVATTQHMVTYTLGLGAQGQMIFDPTTDYWLQTSGDFYDIKVGSTADTSSGVCSWQTTGACNWPTPAADSIANIDDLWHAAINGRGTYFSAKDPTSLADGLTKLLKSITDVPTPGTAAAAATSNPNISASDNYVFSSSYKSVEWFGELIRQQISDTGVLSGQQWSAMRMLDCATTPWKATASYLAGNVYKNGSTCYIVTTDYTSAATFGTADTNNNLPVTGAPVSRAIYTKSGSATSLISFAWASLTGGQQANFTGLTYNGSVTPPTGLSQFCSSGGTCLTSAQQTNTTIATSGAAGEALVNFIRGDRSNEGTFYRTRVHVLGDIVSSEARYVQKPLYQYVDANYAEFKTLKASRAGAVYVAANDGMLHAFDAATGQENWAYIPSMVLPNLYKLADRSYSSQHQYFVDNTPEVGDICPNAPGSTCADNQWKTILVGGLNRGGKGYYALDITDPATPVLLWEFTDANLGYSFGNPVITKLKTGAWVVMFSSGYNNGDGLGRLYVLNANTGSLIRSIANTSGSASAPSGLAGIAGYANAPLTNNTSIAAYGGDLLGQLWRFDINGDIGAAGYDAQLLASFKDAGGTAQSIQAKPTVITKNGVTIVMAGTGRFLGTSDVANSQYQSFYAVKDTLGSAVGSLYGAIRTVATGFVQQTFTAGTCPSSGAGGFCVAGQAVRTSSSNAVDWSTKNGWYVDFLTGGERSTNNPSLQLGTLLFTTITPLANSANPCGDDAGTAASFLYALDYSTGGAVGGASGASGGVAGIGIGNTLATAPIFTELSDGSVVALVRTSNPSGNSGGAGGTTDLATTELYRPPTSQGGIPVVRRISWRELPTQ